MKKCDIRFKVENDLTTIGAVDESNNIQDITAVTEYKNQFDKEARFFYNYKKEVFAFDGYQLKFNESNLKEFNKIQKNENNYYRTRLGDNLVTVRENLEVFVEQGLNSVENFNFKDKENKLFDKGIPFENISIEQRQALSKQNIIYPANIINKTDLPIEIKNYVNLYNQYISLNSSNRANFATNRSVINENTVLYLDSANKLNYIMAASDLASLEESEVHGNNYLSIALAQRGEQEDVNISESVSDNPVYAKGIKELKTELKELVDKRGRVLLGKERQYNNAKKHLAFLEQSVYDQMKSAIILFLQENKIKVNYSLANSLYEIAIKSDTTADFHEKMRDRFSNDIKLPFVFSYFDSWGMSISELMKKEYNRINTESKKFDGKDGIYIERTHRAKDFNNYIRKNGDRQTKYIWKLIKNVAFKINPKIKFVFEENFRDINYAEAFTQDQTNFKSTRIEIRASLLQNPKWAAATLVHEIIHSIAHNIIDIVVFNEKKQIHLLTERQINAVKELTKLIKEVQANDKTNKFYGATDAHELLSELTNKEFVEALKEKAPNIFRRIQNFFLNILGIEKNKYRRAEAILKDIISKPVHITEIGNTIYPGLFPQKTFYKNDFLESVADSNLKLPIDLKQQSVKPGVSELFNENPELANAVYEVLGFKSLNMDSFMPKEHWQIGHIIDNPTEAANICDNTQIRVLNYVLDKFGKAKERGTFYAKPVAIWAKSPINDKQILHYTVAVRINNKVYLYDMPQSEYIEYVSENKGKIIKEYKPRLIEYTPDNLKKYYGTSDENLTIQDETILTDALININLSTSQQKQQAQQLYSQYLDTKFPDSKVKDIVYHYTDAKKFDKFVKDYIGSSVERTRVNAADSELGIFFGKKGLEGVVNKEKLGTTEIPALINIKNPNNDIYDKADEYLYSSERFIDEQEPDYDIELEEDENGNIKNVYKEKDKLKGKDLERAWYNSYKKDLIAQGKDGVVLDNIKIVFEPEQIHILGSKQDIEGFKGFVQKDNSSEINSSVSDDIDFNRESNKSNISESISGNVNTQEGLNLTKSITVDETTNTVNINDILVNGTTTIKATSEFTIEGISDSNIETLIIEAPSVNVNTENFNVETLIIKTESQTSFPDINISQNSNIKSLQIQNSNTNLEITDLTSENNLVFKNFVFADKNDCFLDNFTETSGFTINSAEPFKYSLNFDNSKNLTILQTNELKEIPVSIRNIENLTLEEDVEINIVSMQTTALNLNVNENNIIRLEKKYEKAAINIQAEEPTNITLHGKTRVNLDFKDKFVSINNNVSLIKDSDISFQEEAWSETEKFQEQQEKVLEKQYDSVEEYIDNDDPFDLKTSIDSYISEFNSINPELKKTAKIVQVEADSHAIYRENHTTTLTISESVADILEDRSPYIKVSEEEATNALMSSLNPASFLTVNEQLLATSVLDIDIDHLANKIISGLIYINVNSVGMNVRTLFDNLTHLKEQFKDEKVVLENLKKLDSKLNEKYAELKVRIQKDSVTYSERVHKALEDTVLDENEETQQKRVLELSRKKLNAFYTEQVNTLYKQLKEVTKQIELLLQEDTSAEFRVPAALKIKLQEKITDLKDQRLRVRNLRAEDIVSEFTVSLSNLTPLLDSYTEFIKFLEDNKEEINSVTLTHTIDKTIQDLVIALGQEQSKMETAKLLAFKDGKKVPETALDAYTSEMLKSLAGRVQLLSTRTSALARQSFFKYAAEVLNVDVADIAREIKALQDNGLPDTHILDEWFFDPTKGLFMPDKAGLFPSLMQMTLDSEINAWRSYAIRLSTDLNNVKEEGDKALKKIRIDGRKMNALDFKARNKYGRYTKHFIDVYNEDYIQNYKAVWRTLNELLKFKLDTPEKKNKSLKPFIDQIANQYEAVNIFKLSAFADLKGKRLPVYMDIDFQVDAEYEQSLKDKYGEEVFNYLVEQSKEKFLNKIQNWEYDFKSVAVANNAESFAELQAKNPEAANTLLEKLKDRLPLPSDFKDASYVAKTKLFVNSFTVPTSTKVFNKFFIDNVLGNETIRKYYTALKNLENYIINQKNELDNVSYAAPLVKYKTFLEHFTDNRENHSFLMKTSAAFRSLFKDVNKLWFKTYKVPGEVTGIATQESLSIIPKAVPSNFYKNQMAIKKIAEAANSAVLTKKIPATSDSFVHFIFEKVANLPFVKGVTTVEDLMTEFNEIRANYVRISDAQNAVINSLLTHLEYEKSSTDLAETLKAHLLIINMATSRNMAQGKINILLKYFQDIKKTIKQKGTTTVSDRVRAKALSAVQTWYDKNIIGANLEADPDSAGKLRLGKENRELLEYLRKEGILTEKESKEIQPFFTYKKLSAGAIVTAFLKYTIWKGLGWNMKSGSTNFMQGMFDDFIAGASGKYYTADYYYKALRMLPQSMFKFFTFSHKLVPKALGRNLENSDAVKFRRLMDKFKVLQDSSNLLQQAGKNEKFLNTQKLDAFHWQKSIEYLNQGVLILGEIYSRDIQIDENTKVKLWDLFDQQSNLKEEYASNKELYINWQLGRGKQFNAFTSKVNKMIVEVHGDYQETRGFKASHSEVGRALILFKKFFPQQVANRWSKKQTVYELGEDTMGRTEDSLDKMQTIGRYRALTPSAAALVGAANIRTSLSAALLRPIFGDRLKPLLSIADAVISPWLLPVTAIGAVTGATWAIAAKLYNGKQKGAKIFGDMPQVLGRTLYGFITTPVNVLAGRELLKNTYSNKSLSALENLAMNESLNDVRVTLFMTMLGMLIRWKLHRDPNDDVPDDEESTTDQVLLAILNRIDVNLAEHTQYTDPPSMLQFLDLTESSPANTLAQMINMPIKVQKQMERIEKMTEIEKYFLTDSDYDRASYWVGFKETFLPSPARKYWGWSSSMNFDFTTEIKTREIKQFVPALYHPIEWLTTTEEQREEKEMEARILNIKNAYKKEFKNLYFDYFQSLDESEKNEFADELKEIINKAMVKPKYLDNEQTLSFFENESMLRAKVNLSIKKFYFTDRFKQQQVKIKNNKEAQAAYNAVIKLFEKQKNDDLYKINGGAILNYSTKYKIYKKEIINRERELKEALNRAGINYITPKAVEKVVI